jgi:hypothetical protein
MGFRGQRDNPVNSQKIYMGLEQDDPDAAAWGEPF